MSIARRVTVPGTVVTLTDVFTYIDNCFDDETLRRIHKRAADRIRNEIVEIKRRNFDEGDLVCFDSKKRGMVYGKIIKINRTNAKVLSDAGIKWTVHIGLLKAA